MIVWRPLRSEGRGWQVWLRHVDVVDNVCDMEQQSELKECALRAQACE